MPLDGSGAMRPRGRWKAEQRQESLIDHGNKPRAAPATKLPDSANRSRQKLVRSNTVDREFRVIAAPGKQGLPVAKAHALCTDDGVIGAAFYITR